MQFVRKIRLVGFWDWHFRTTVLRCRFTFDAGPRDVSLHRFVLVAFPPSDAALTSPILRTGNLFTTDAFDVGKRRFHLELQVDNIFGTLALWTENAAQWFLVAFILYDLGGIGVCAKLQ